jgi:hypothetical protein
LHNAGIVALRKIVDGQRARCVLPENVRFVVGILTMLCLLGVSSRRDRERTLDEPIRASLNQAKQLPVIGAAARRQASPLDAQLQVFTVVDAIELADRSEATAISIERAITHRVVEPVRSVSSRGPPRG